MKNLFKKFALIGMVLCLCAGIFAFAACNGDSENSGGDGKVTYTVTVISEDNSSALNYVLVELRDSDGNSVAQSSVAVGSPITQGTATLTADAGTYSVYLVEKAGFEGALADEDLLYSIETVSEAHPAVSISIAYAELDSNVELITYTVTALLPDGSPAADIVIQLCGGPNNTCKPMKAGSDGVAVFSLAAGEYEVHIEQQVEGCKKFDNTLYKVDAENTEITVQFEAA